MAYTNDDNVCPSQVEETWHYWNGSSWVAAQDGLIVQCISEPGKDLYLMYLSECQILRFSECCGKIRVAQGYTALQQKQNTALYQAQEGKLIQIFTNYIIEPDKINRRNHYTSTDGKYALAYVPDQGQWYIQSVEKRY